MLNGNSIPLLPHEALLDEGAARTMGSKSQANKLERFLMSNQLGCERLKSNQRFGFGVVVKL